MITNPFEILEERLIRIESLLFELNDKLNKPTRQTEESDQLVDIKEASELLHLSVPTIYGFVHQSTIPVSKKGKRLYFSRKDLLAWVNTGRRRTKQEITAEADTYLKKHNRSH
jgi:excisionase family DNA binding protein